MLHWDRVEKASSRSAHRSPTAAVQGVGLHLELVAEAGSVSILQVVLILKAGKMQDLEMGSWEEAEAGRRAAGFGETLANRWAGQLPKE